MRFGFRYLGWARCSPGVCVIEELLLEYGEWVFEDASDEIHCAVVQPESLQTEEGVEGEFFLLAFRECGHS